MQSPNEKTTVRSTSYPEVMPHTSAELIRELDRTIPKITLDHAITAEGRDDFNWALARRSVVCDLLRLLERATVKP